MKDITNCHFKLKTGVLLQDSKGLLPMATVANLTDEIAIAYLRDNRKRINLFVEVPEDLEELLATEPAPANATGDENANQGDANKEDEQSATDAKKALENGQNDGQGEGDANQGGDDANQEQAELTAEAINAMSYNDLKAEVAKRGIKTEGTKKADLIDALLSAL